MKYFEKYTKEDWAEIFATAHDSAKRVARAKNLGEIILREFPWKSTFINKIAKAVKVPDGVTPSYKNRQPIDNKIFFIASDDGVVQHSTIRAQSETTVSILNLVQSEFWPMFGNDVEDLSQEEEALSAIQSSYDRQIDKLGWTIVKASVSSSAAVDKSAEVDKKMYASYLDELITYLEDKGYGNVMTDGVLFINAKRLAQLRVDLRNNNQKIEDVFKGEIVSMPSTADTKSEYGMHLGHAEAYLMVPGSDLARDYQCLVNGKVIHTEDTPPLDHSFKQGVKSITRRALAVVNTDRIAYLKMTSNLV
jgi:hypothetical protein